MTSFHIGQRVRITRGHFKGHEGIIIKFQEVLPDFENDPSVTLIQVHVQADQGSFLVFPATDIEEI